ncbi:SDR family oxidoreductase [Mobilitalea sibirica]|uniref:SDR family oxidoreductase n=1 Tax=Mobilitalea sibirica TaxID=1462919 RepID=A0A8J7H684_9FIRM|nr:SDR family oxidoreductase [Mobilitalea sibirica]MBH1942254.1 SDR family oxidoreductase [Mobilitalea sibirica]
MKALFIGGTGTISTAITALAPQCDIELYLINRGNKMDLVPEGVKVIQADINNEADIKDKLKNMTFDVVAQFIAFDTDALERDFRLFEGKTKQYIFISSASAYQKPLASPYITESTPLSNPYWEYSRKKIACEEYLMKQYRENGFPVTIVRPSHTYGDFSVPLAIHGKNGSYSVIDRIRNGKKVIIHGDGSSLWTLTHNTDFAKAFVGLMGNVHAIGDTVHITSDESLTWNQIYEIIGSALGVKPNIVHIPSETLAKADPELSGGLLGDKTHTVIFDNTKIKRLVPGFQATVRFDQGIRKTLAYILSHEELQSPDPEFDTWTDRMIQLYEEYEAKLSEI